MLIIIGYAAQKRGERKRKRNTARRNNRGPDLPATIALNILEHAQIVQDRSVAVDEFPHTISAFAGKDDRADVANFTARGLPSGPYSTVSLDTITVKESLSLLDPNCPTMVQNLITNHSYRYIVNDPR